jgi:hypothetical protein
MRGADKGQAKGRQRAGKGHTPLKAALHVFIVHLRANRSELSDGIPYIQG